MKKIILLLAVVLMSGVAMAQGQRGEKRGSVDPKVRAEKMTDRMAQELSLTDAQKQKVLALNLTRVEEMEANRPEKPAEPAARKSDEAKAARQEAKQERSKVAQEYDAQLKSILTPEQYTKYTELKANKKGDKDVRGKKDNRKGDRKGNK